MHGIMTLDADKSMPDNALLGDPDRGLAHVQDTLRPYFVKGVDHVFLWHFLLLFGQHEFVHWIGHFEVAQKRLLASWSGVQMNSASSTRISKTMRSK